MASPKVAICISPEADDLQRSAAGQLRDYLQQLFGVTAEVEQADAPNAADRILLGRPADAHVAQATRDIPALSDQGHLVRRVDPHTLVLAGGSSAAVAWAAYELAERYGVRYLLHEDVLPEDPGPFHLPDVDAVFEPVQRMRCWRQSNVLPHGPLLWSLDQQRQFITQLFKLKFNGIYLMIWPQHPMVDYEIEGIRRTSWGLLFATPIPIDDENIGREHLWANMTELTHPDFVGLETFDEALAAGQRLFKGVFGHAQSLGMHTCAVFQPMDFPNEFRLCLQAPSEVTAQGPIAICAETAELTNPKHVNAMTSRFQAFIDQWGYVDEFAVHLPEQPTSDESYRGAWQALAGKFGLEPEYDLDQLVALSRRNYLVPGGVARAQREFKSTIAMLQFFDTFFAGNDILDQLAERDIRFNVVLGGTSEQVFPFVHRVLPPGCGMRTVVDYTSSRAVRRLSLLEKVDTSKINAYLIVTLQDDNIGWVPQMATESIHLLLQTMARHGWAGFYTRHWPVGELDPMAAYLARAAWDATYSPRHAYLDHAAHVYGPESTELWCQFMRLIEDVSVILDLDFLSLLYPVHNTMWNKQANRPMAEGLFHIKANYEAGRTLLEHIAASPGPRARDANLAYWQSRLDFAIHALDEIALLHEGRMALESAKQAKTDGDDDAVAQHRARAAERYDQAVTAGEAAVRAAADHIRDDSDRGAVAAYYHFMVRQVKARAADALDEVAS